MAVRMISSPTLETLDETARQEGMRHLAESALDAVVSGRTALSEVLEFMIDGD